MSIIAATKIMMNSNKTTTAITAALIGITSYYLINYRKSKRKNKSINEIKGNFYAKGSEIVELYNDRIYGKTFIVTGATSGLGKQTTLLLAKGATRAIVDSESNTSSNVTNIILGVRNVELGNELKKEIEGKYNNSTDNKTKDTDEDEGQKQRAVNILVFHLDLSSFESVQKFASNVLDTGFLIDGLIHNAGVYGIKGNSVNDGMQITFQTNALSPALLTELILPILTKDGRVLFVSSKTAMFAKGDIPSQCPIVQAATVKDNNTASEAKTDGSTAQDYILSKACQILNAYELNYRFLNDNYKFHEKRAMSIEPGLVNTNILRNTGYMTKFINITIIGKLFGLLKSVDEGVSTTLFCLLAPIQVLDQDYYDENVNKKEKEKEQKHIPYYYADCKPCLPPSLSCRDINQALALTKLYELCFKENKMQLML